MEIDINNTKKWHELFLFPGDADKGRIFNLLKTQIISHWKMEVITFLN